VASRMDADQGTLMSTTAVNLQGARAARASRYQLDPVARQRGDRREYFLRRRKPARGANCNIL
jgi:hypothetical protein